MIKQTLCSSGAKRKLRQALDGTPGKDRRSLGQAEERGEEEKEKSQLRSLRRRKS